MLISVFLLLSLTPSLPARHGSVTPGHRAVITCAAVSKGEIEASLGQRLEGAREESEKVSTCSYGGGSAAVTVSVTQLDSEFNLASELENLKAAFPGSTLTAAPVIAPGAYVLQIPQAGTQVHLVSENHEYVMVSVLGVASGRNGLDAAAEIARRLFHSARF